MANKVMFEEEKDLVHVYLAIRRKKENPEITAKDELCFRQIEYDDSDIDILKQRIKNIPGTWRIYKTVNRRNVQKARKMLIHWFIDDRYTDKRFESVFKKALLTKECRAEKYALVDIDTKDKVVIDEVINIVYKNTEVLESIETPNGFHIIAKPFDRRLLSEYKYVEIDYDRYKFIDRITIDGVSSDE